MRGKRKKEFGYRRVFIILCTAFWVIFPFITRLSVIKVPEIEEEYFSTNKGYIVDLLLYCKEIALALFAGAVILYFLGERIFPDKVIKLDRNRFKSLILPVSLAGVYLLLSVLSFAFSSYKETAFWGANSEYEGLLAIISYIVVFFFALIFLKDADAAQILKCGINILCLIVGILSIIEIFYKPILEISFVQDLISSDKYSEVAHSIKNENFIGQICLTFNNPGFLGGFCALFIPLNFCLSIEGKKAWKMIGLIGTGLMGLTIVWSDSKVAMVSLIATIPLSIFLLTFKNRKEIKKFFVYFGIILAVAVVTIGASKLLPTFSSRTRTTERVEEGTIGSGEIFKLSKAEIIGGELYLYSGENLLKISVDQEKYKECYWDDDLVDYSSCLVLSDGEKVISGRLPVTLKATNIREEKQGFRPDDERYKAVSICVQKEMVIIDLGYSGTIEFYIVEGGLKIFGQGSSLHEEISQPKVTGLESIYHFATGRGYVWVQALPILKDSLILGGGCGTFAFRFVQNEIVGLLNTHGSCKYVIDRPHNWYLQIACSSGVLALISVLALFIWYIIIFIRQYIKTKTIDYIDIGLFAGLLGFLICGMINDSCITVNPWFWMLFGTAVARRKCLTEKDVIDIVKKRQK